MPGRQSAGHRRAGWGGDISEAGDRVLLSPSPLALPSLCALRLSQEAFGAFRFLERTHTFKSLWCKLGNAPGCLRACQHRQDSQERASTLTLSVPWSLRAARVTFPPVPWSGGSPACLQSVRGLTELVVLPD